MEDEKSVYSGILLLPPTGKLIKVCPNSFLLFTININIGFTEIMATEILRLIQSK